MAHFQAQAAEQVVKRTKSFANFIQKIKNELKDKSLTVDGDVRVYWGESTTNAEDASLRETFSGSGCVVRTHTPVIGGTSVQITWKAINTKVTSNFAVSTATATASSTPTAMKIEGGAAATAGTEGKNVPSPCKITTYGPGDMPNPHKIKKLNIALFGTIGTAPFSTNGLDWRKTMVNEVTKRLAGKLQTDVAFFDPVVEEYVGTSYPKLQMKWESDVMQCADVLVFWFGSQDGDVARIELTIAMCHGLGPSYIGMADNSDGKHFFNVRDCHPKPEAVFRAIMEHAPGAPPMWYIPSFKGLTDAVVGCIETRRPVINDPLSTDGTTAAAPIHVKPTASTCAIASIKIRDAMCPMCKVPNPPMPLTSQCCTPCKEKFTAWSIIADKKSPVERRFIPVHLIRETMFNLAICKCPPGQLLTKWIASFAVTNDMIKLGLFTSAIMELHKIEGVEREPLTKENFLSKP